jgi:hypothetical protein
MESIEPGACITMLKGEPGCRKSTIAVSYPKPQYWFDFDGKMSSLLIPMRNWNIDRKDVEFDSYKDWTNARIKLEKFQSSLKLTDGRKIETLVLDSITTMGDSVNQQTLSTKRGQKNSDGDNMGKIIGGINVNTIDDFNAETAGFQELFALAKDICNFHKINFIMIAHVLQTEFKSLNGDSTFSRTIVTGAKKMAAKMPAYCTEIYHTQTKGTLSGVNDGFKAFTQHTGDDFARTALPLPATIEFKAEPFYGSFILPAIEKLKKGNLF